MSGNTCVDAPLAEQATFRETGGPHDLSNHVHLSHCPERGKYNHSLMRKVYNYLHLIDGKTEAHQVRSNMWDSKLVSSNHGGCGFNHDTNCLSRSLRKIEGRETDAPRSWRVTRPAPKITSS